VDCSNVTMSKKTDVRQWCKTAALHPKLRDPPPANQRDQTGCRRNCASQCLRKCQNTEAVHECQKGESVTKLPGLYYENFQKQVYFLSFSKRFQNRTDMCLPEKYICA
jgi:hypothetical protein